jgi:hypothetical protein
LAFGFFICKDDGSELRDEEAQKIKMEVFVYRILLFVLIFYLLFNLIFSSR